MSSSPAFQMYTGDWLKTAALSMCEPATRGIWIDLCCAIWDADNDGAISGTVRQLSRACRCDVQEMQAAIDELTANDVAEVAEEGGVFTIVSRRMRKQLEEMHGNRDRQRKHRSKRKSNGNSNGIVTDDVTALSEEGRVKSEEEDLIVLNQEKEENAIGIFKRITGYSPPIYFCTLIDAEVRDLEAWEGVVTQWMDSEYRPQNVKGLVDLYKTTISKPGQDNGKRRNGSQSGLSASQQGSLSGNESLNAGGWSASDFEDAGPVQQSHLQLGTGTGEGDAEG